MTIDLRTLLLYQNQVANANSGVFTSTSNRTGFILPVYNASSISISLKASCGYNLVYFSSYNISSSNSNKYYLGSLSTSVYTTTSLNNYPIPNGCLGIYVNINTNITYLRDVFDYIVFHNADLGSINASNYDNSATFDKNINCTRISVVTKTDAPVYYRTLYSTIPGMTSSFQSMIMHGEYIVYFMFDSKSAFASIYDIGTKEYIGRIDLPTGGYKIAHCNVANCGPFYWNGNTELPLVYLSQWDYDGERATLVYNIDPINLQAELVQCIRANIPNEIFGSGATDWCLDNERGYIYSLAYYDKEKGPHSSGAVYRDGKTRVCCFKLPSPTEGNDKKIVNDAIKTTEYSIKEVIFTENDLIDAPYDLPIALVSQDKVCNDGKMYIGCGSVYYGQDTLLIRIIDLNKKEQVDCIPIAPFTKSEPEGLVFYDGKLLMSFQGEGAVTGDIWEWHIKNHV